MTVKHNSFEKSGIAKYYIILFIVIITWGLDPIINSFFYDYYSASVVSTLCTCGSAVMFWIMAMGRLREFTIDYVKIAIPISLISALANLSQRIGLQYTTPSNYSFLERLAIPTVPIALFIMTGKKPTFMRVIASLVCIAGCFVFSGASFSGLDFGIGEILCSLAGILGGIAIAATGVYLKKLDASLYITVYMTIYFLTSLTMTVSLNAIKSGGVPLEEIRFTPEPALICILILFGLFDVGICWLMRTQAIKYISPAKVTLLNPLSAVITGVVSICVGTDTLSVRFVVGTILILIAVILSGIDGINKKSIK